MKCRIGYEEAWVEVTILKLVVAARFTPTGRTLEVTTEQRPFWLPFWRYSGDHINRRLGVPGKPSSEAG